MEENQSQIPEGWESCQLGKLANFTTGKKDVNEGSSEGLYPFYTCSKRVLKSNVYSFDNEALMVAGNGDVGTVHYYNGKFEAYQRTYVLSNFKIDVQYLFQYLKSNLVKHLTEGQSGTTIQFIKINQLTDFKILKPKSTSEQTTIANILSKVDNAIVNTEALIAKYTQIKTGLMQDLLTKGIDENGNIRTEQTHEFKDSPLGRIPKEWECEKLDYFLQKKQYGISLPMDEQGTYPILRMNNIKHGELFLNDLKYSSAYINEDLLLNDKDVLFNRTNSIEHVGRTGIFRNQGKPFSFASYLVRLIPNSKVNPEFLNLVLNFNQNQDRIKLIATSAVHQANINPTNLGRLFFVFPKYNEQGLIIIYLEKINSLIKIENIELSKLQSLKTGLMQDLLSGKVRVNKL